MPRKTFLAFLQILVVMTIAPAAFASPEKPGGGLITLNDVGTGALLLRTGTPGQYVSAPLVASDFDIQVSGPIVRATLSQRFRNPSDQWVEGRYAFPLPDEAAVDGLRMRIGERFIEGEIREREEARKVYEQARQEGRKAALVEQQRPNLFTNDVANIGPDETVVVQITWLQVLAPVDGAFRLRLPLVAAPRYNPNPVVHAVDFGPNGWAVKDPVPNRGRLESPLVDPRAQEKGAIHNPVTISVDLAAGFPVDVIESRHHAIHVARSGDDTARITIDGAVPANRDFTLTWTSAVEGPPSAALFKETVDGRDYYVAMLTPATARDDAPRPPRQITFVQDVSGSMDGESIRQAREGLRLALERLTPADSFNLIIFNDQYGTFADRPVPATETNIRRALSTVDALQAGGGTEMLPALRAALADQWTADGQLRQVVFLTDGAVGNEAQMLDEISRKLGRTRLFTVGIGSAPNSYFMTRAAELGRGATVYVDDLSAVSEQMATLFAKLEQPVLTGLRAGLPDGASDLSPNPLPDLYAGEPLVVAFHVPEGAGGEIEIRASLNGQPWRWTLPVANAAPRDGIAKLWARKRIRALESLTHSPVGADMGYDRLEAELLKVALTHRLVSRLTSLVAVDKTPSRPGDSPLSTRDVPLNLPEGWNPAVFLDQTAPSPQPAMRKAQLSGTQMAALKIKPAPAVGAAPPRGALNWKGRLVIGLVLLVMAGLAVLVLRSGRANQRRLA